MTARGVQKDDRDEVEVAATRRPPLVSREQVVDKAVELLAAEGTSGLSMRKLASALHVSLPTVYTAVQSRNHLVQHVLDVALQRQVREVGRAVGPGHVDPSVVLDRFVAGAEACSWLHDLVAELDTETLSEVVRHAAEATSPSVLDHLVTHLSDSDVGHPAREREPATLLLLIVLLLDDIVRLVAARCCLAEDRGPVAHALLDALLAPAPRREVVAAG